MTDELGREELLEWLKDLYSAANTYGWGGDKDNQAYQQIRTLIQKPEVDEEWIEEKAKELITMVSNLYPHEGSPCVIPKNEAKDFIRLLVEEMPAKKATVSEEWIWKAIEYIKEYPTYHRLEEKLKEAGVEVMKK